jgi:hypothetical protein
MGKMTFQLPSGLQADAARELQRTCMAGGPDNMPWPTELHSQGDQLTVSRAVDESGYLVVPWAVEGRGRVMGASATLIERPQPYNLLVELARGKVNQVRCQAADWRAGGLQLSEPLQKLIDDASQTFGRAVTGPTGDEASRQAQAALDLAYRAADQLVRAYVEQVFAIRHQRQPQLETALACRLGNVVPPIDLAAELRQAFNTVSVPLSWSQVEGTEEEYRWEASDEAVEWALAQGFEVTAGPLIDFTSSQLPAWLWLWERELPTLATFMCKFVETAARRYRNRIRRWQLTAASNWGSVLSLSEDDLLGLTYRLADAARQTDPGLKLMIGIAQPWGEYMALADRSHSPFIFADTLIRSGLNLDALDVEVVMGVQPRGSYCRDLLEVSRLLDLYALLGVPLRVTLGYPAAAEADPDADPELNVQGGYLGAGFTPEVQAEWAAAYSTLAVCKPFVQSVQWVQCSDAGPHPFPHCGLFDSANHARPALARLAELRGKHLR